MLADADAVARRGAAVLAECARAAVAGRGAVTVAVSGGRTPWTMLAQLAGEEVPWRQARVYQVDERVVPEGHSDRNLTHLREALPRAAQGSVVPMDVEAEDLERAAAAYAAALPERLDLVHLGLGADGHTASLVPGDPVLDVTDRDVAVTAVYQGHRRMTLTYPALARARRILWLVTGADKAGALARLLAHDRAIPAARVANPDQLVLADRSAARA